MYQSATECHILPLTGLNASVYKTCSSCVQNFQLFQHFLAKLVLQESWGTKYTNTAWVKFGVKWLGRGSLLDQNFIVDVFPFCHFVSKSSRSRHTCAPDDLSENDWKSSQLLQFRTQFCRNCKFLFSLIEKCPGAIFWSFFGKNRKPGTPQNFRSVNSQISPEHYNEAG